MEQSGVSRIAVSGRGASDPPLNRDSAALGPERFGEKIRGAVRSRYRPGPPEGDKQ